MANFCGKCGNKLDSNIFFCGKCGNKIKTIEKDLDIAKRFDNLKDIDDKELQEYISARKKILKYNVVYNLLFFCIALIIFVIGFQVSLGAFIFLIISILPIVLIYKNVEEFNIIKKAYIRIADCISYKKLSSTRSRNYSIKIKDKKNNLLNNLYEISYNAYSSDDEVIAKLYIIKYKNIEFVDVIALHDLNNDKKSLRIHKGMKIFNNY